MMATDSSIPTGGRLRREYFRQEETEGPRIGPCAGGLHADPSDARAVRPARGFSLGGHRLSSLSRTAEKKALTLIQRYFRAASSWSKYSGGSRGSDAGQRPPAPPATKATGETPR